MTPPMLLGQCVKHRTSGAYGFVGMIYPGGAVFVSWNGAKGSSEDVGAYVSQGVLELAPDVCVEDAS